MRSRFQIARCAAFVAAIASALTGCAATHAPNAVQAYSTEPAHEGAPPRAAEPTTSVASDAAALEAADASTAAPASASPPAEPVVPIRLKIPGDKPVWVVPGDPTGPTLVYLHGRCGDPHAFVAWAAVGRRFGTVVSLSGDEKCKDGQHDKWSGDVVAIDRRASRAIEVARKELSLTIGDARRIAVGYSQGSLMAEALGTRFPQRYPEVVLIAGPRGPKDDHLKDTRSVLIMVGDLDARLHLREATTKLEQRGKRVRYLELPGARHGEYGTEAEARMEDGLRWLTKATDAPASPDTVPPRVTTADAAHAQAFSK